MDSPDPYYAYYIFVEKPHKLHNILRSLMDATLMIIPNIYLLLNDRNSINCLSLLSAFKYVQNYAFVISDLSFP